MIDPDRDIEDRAFQHCFRSIDVNDANVLGDLLLPNTHCKNRNVSIAKIQGLTKGIRFAVIRAIGQHNQRTQRKPSELSIHILESLAD